MPADGRASFGRRLEGLLWALRAHEGTDLFNPYRDNDPELDRPRGAAIRRRNLRSYLSAFREARFVLVGEAAGYNGCRFSGIPFTGENLLVGERPLTWAEGLGLERSSRGPKLSAERSAHIVWGGLGGGREFVLWNAVPWHPHHPGRSLSNRKPRRAEIDTGSPILEGFLELYPRAQPVAVGRVAEAALRACGHDPIYVRHPSMGGKPRFLRGLQALRARL
ncbi:MAG: uracil-DNA glycosylase [Planctomycetota bacterium]